ncbi:hypothetical protein VST7929_03201 [Vibrio stylophorae]|uniref:Uncharacterized protein n=1 Tax=Vibrio stylophorae TaxID=659351 RepID=A0ABM8ZXZ0_9VIBR|nr:hypothetical protein [Vibrio stylophorae]CAH0535727.1 hypothetical protein VST7929_03201 [Vibrio stylophorae]
MQWLAVGAAMLWSIFQLGMLILSLQFCMGFIGYDPAKRGWAWLLYLCFLGMLASYISLMLVPLISTGLFWYHAIDITQWGDLMPAIQMFFYWFAVAAVFFAFLMLSEWTREKRNGWGPVTNQSDAADDVSAQSAIEQRSAQMTTEQATAGQTTIEQTEPNKHENNS